MGSLSRDLRAAVRRLRCDRGVAAVTILTLGLGIGANTAMFSLVRAVILSPLPYHEPDRLAVVWNAADLGERTLLSLQEVASYAIEASTLERMSAYTEIDANLTGGTDPERVRAAAVTVGLFDTLEVPAQAGRTIGLADEGVPPAEVIVLGHGLWQRRFGGDPGIVGQAIQVNGRTRTVIGIMPPWFRLPLDYRAARPTEAWIPLTVDPANLGPWGNRSYIGVARLRSGATPETATSELAVIGGRWIRAGYVADQGDGRLFRAAVPVPEMVAGGVRPRLLLLLGAVMAILLIACANVANLLLARADVRRHEVVVRAALGAGRADLARQLLTESVTLSMIGGAFSLAVAWAALRLVVVLRPAGLPRVEDVSLDLPVLGAAAVLAMVTGVVFGLAPALRLSRPDLSGVLGDSGRSLSPGRARKVARGALVVAQVASSLVLALGAGLLIRSLVELNRVDLGFDPRGVLTAQLQVPAPDYPENADVVRFYRQLVERIRELPGVTDAGAVRILPLSRSIGDWSITIEGRPFDPVENPNADFQAVTPGYFSAMGVAMVRGRAISDVDHENAPLSAVINETMAERYWPGEDALGRRFRMGTGDQPWLTIVGIVRTVRHNAITEAPRAEMYVPHAQLPREIGSAPRGMALAVRTSGDPLALAGPVREAVRALDRNLPVSDLRPLAAVAADALAQPRFTTWLLGAFAALALALAAVGIYGTVSLLVAERSAEMGIRMALGADRGSILRLVMGQGLSLAGAGVAIGLAGGVAVTRGIASLVYGVGTLDPLTFVAVPALLCAVAALACLVPARRAASLDPVLTLRRG
jgi:putative ABC transport system permease protein